MSRIFYDQIPPETGRRYSITANPDGTSSITDVTEYIQEGTPWGAAEANDVMFKSEYDPSGYGPSFFPVTATYENGVFTLIGLPDSLPDIFTVRFKAPADYTDGDTFLIGSTELTAKLTNLDNAPGEMFKSGAVVTMEVDMGVGTAFFKSGGGGFPDGWRDVRTAEATEDIVKNQAIMYRQYADIDDGLEAVPDPSVLPADTGQGCSFSPDGNYLAVAHDTTPFVTIYKRSGDTFTKLSNPSVLPTGNGQGCSFSPDGNYLAVAHSDTPFITIYKRSGDTFTKLSNPSALPTGNGYGCSFSPDGNYLAVAHGNTPFITIYKRSGDTFTKLSNPSVLPTGYGQGCSFSPDGNYLAVAHISTPFITIYKRSGDTFTKLSNPSTLPAGVGQGCSFSPDGNYLAVTHNNTPFITIYKRSGDTFTKLSNPSVLPASYAWGCSFSPDMGFLAVVHNNSPYITIYGTQEGGFVSPLTIPWGGIYIPSRYLGIALQNANQGELCKVNLFPALNLQEV